MQNLSKSSLKSYKIMKSMQNRRFWHDFEGLWNLFILVSFCRFLWLL